MQAQVTDSRKLKGLPEEQIKVETALALAGVFSWQLNCKN